jgi:hypothetical protein
MPSTFAAGAMLVVSVLTFSVVVVAGSKLGGTVPALVMPADWLPSQVATPATETSQASGPALAARGRPSQSAPAATVPSSAARNPGLSDMAMMVLEPAPASAL